VNYTWGMNKHAKFGGAIMPEIMRWLWRDGPVSTDPNDMTGAHSARLPLNNELRRSAWPTCGVEYFCEQVQSIPIESGVSTYACWFVNRPRHIDD
jgi:hypothetical protein